MRAVVRLDRRTKELIPRLRPGDVALIAHEDLDEVAAKGLKAARVSAVVNARPFITGRYPNPGPAILAQASIVLVDEVGDNVFDLLRDGDEIELVDGRILRSGECVGEGRILTLEEIEERLRRARENVVREIEAFVDNTLEYARREKRLVTGELDLPRMQTSFKDRAVVVVVRGRGYREDLSAVGSYIEETNPVLVGVDGGADALIEAGHRPDVIVGDMDSVSDAALVSGAELIVHAYPDGRAPGWARLERLGLAGRKVCSLGTSEDVALLLAYQLGARLIVAVGTHSNIVDFLEKGRQGMASTFLVRLKVGDILIDAKGLNEVYRGRPQGKYWVVVLVSALAPLLLLAFIAEPVNYWLRLMVLYFRITLGSAWSP